LYEKWKTLFTDKGKNDHDLTVGLKTVLYIKKNNNNADSRRERRLEENTAADYIYQDIYKGHKKNMREHRVCGRSGISLDMKPRTGNFLDMAQAKQDK